MEKIKLMIVNTLTSIDDILRISIDIRTEIHRQIV